MLPPPDRPSQLSWLMPLERGARVGDGRRGYAGRSLHRVAVLDGGWNRIGEDEDPDEPRRLYYVAMTRARQTLTLARFQGPHRLQEALLGNPSVVHRDPVELPPISKVLEYRHVRASLDKVLGDKLLRYGVPPRLRYPGPGWSEASSTASQTMTCQIFSLIERVVSRCPE